MRSNPATSRGADEIPITLIPKPLHSGASASAMTPMPKIPTVLSLSVFAGNRSHLRSAWLRSERGRSRLNASISRTAASATGAP